MAFNSALFTSGDAIRVYEGDLKLRIHSGQTFEGTGEIDFVRSGVRAFFRVSYRQAGGAIALGLPADPDGHFGAGTALLQIGSAAPGFLFVISGGRGLRYELVGEAQVLEGSPQESLDSLLVYSLNCLLPESDGNFDLGDWEIENRRSPISYDRTRVSVPTAGITFTHVSNIHRKDGKRFTWSEFASTWETYALFMSFVNGAWAFAPVVHGLRDGSVVYHRLHAGRTSRATNERSWATQIGNDDINEALKLFHEKCRDEFWHSVFARTIEWYVLARESEGTSLDQALLTTQLILEMLSYVVLVETTHTLSEAGYAALPASDRIGLLCAVTDQGLGVPAEHWGAATAFCKANSIDNMPTLIATIRNKTIHPTKKNRDYLEKIDSGVRGCAVEGAQRIVYLTILNVIEYRKRYCDLLVSDVLQVPWGR